MTRRAWLALCAAWCLARPRRTGLLGLFADVPRAQRLGQAYTEGMAQAPAALTGSVLQGLSGAGPLRAQVAELVRQDFAAGRMACVDGWMLSETEARLCALAALEG